MIIGNLIERLMGVDEQGVPQSRPYKITAHAFFASCNEMTQGYLTQDDIKQWWDMDEGCYNEFVVLALKIPILRLDDKLAYIERIHGVLMLAEAKFTGYTTPTEVRIKLGI